MLNNRNVPLAHRATLAAFITLFACMSMQWAMIGPRNGTDVAALLVPVVVCSVTTFVITRVIVRNRANDLMTIYSRFQRGEVDDQFRLLGDPEFRESRALFVRLGPEDAVQAFSRHAALTGREDGEDSQALGTEPRRRRASRLQREASKGQETPHTTEIMRGRIRCVKPQPSFGP